MSGASDGLYLCLQKEIFHAERATSAQLWVVVTHRIPERDPARSAETLFESLALTQTRHRNGVLLYLNLRTRRFAWARDKGAQTALGESYWRELSDSFREDLLSTHHELALRMAVRTLGISLARHFPPEDNGL
ncbi:MAG: TPM domain-containing protein [Bdellovibrionales bacterium]|nr:TPM domain-containing protein [Bdellovibrionales bacterium]